MRSADLINDSTACKLAVVFLPMLNAVNENDHQMVVDLKENSIPTRTDPVSLSVSKLLNSYRAWIEGRASGLPENSPDVFVRQTIEVLMSG